MNRRLACVVLMLALAACSSGDSSPQADLTEGVDPDQTSTLPAAPAVTDVALAASCQVNSSVIDMTTDGDTWFIGGDFTSATDVDGTVVTQVGIAACSVSDGLLDDQIELDLGDDGVVRALALTDEHLLLGGTFSVGGFDSENFVALDRSTMAVADWGPKRVPGGVQEIVVAPDGAVYLAGSFIEVDGVARPGIARFGADGVFDSEFSPELADGPDDRPLVYAVAATDDGQVFLGGDFETLNGVAVGGVGRVDSPTGRITGAFAPDLDDTNPNDGRVQIREIVMDGSWTYLCGDWWTTEGRGDKEQQRNVGRFDSSGRADPSFEPWTDGGIRDCALAAGGLVIGGHFDTVSGEPTRKLALLSLLDGAVTPLVSADSPKGVQTIAATEQLLGLGGTFSRAGGQDRSGFAVVQISTP